MIATPVTAVLDFAIMTNPYLINLLNLFRDKPIEMVAIMEALYESGVGCKGVPGVARSISSRSELHR